MKVLLVNGSPRVNGCTFTALTEIAETLKKENIETEIFQLGNKPIRDCIACGGCNGKNKCVFDDDVANSLIAKAAECDGFVFGSPVYYAHPSGRILSVLDRAFYAGKASFTHKPAAAIVSARRGGSAASYDVLNKYFGITQMPIVSSSYWNMVYGSSAEQVKQDAEGMQTMRNIGRNMAWILKCIEAGKAAGISLPQTEASERTNFIR
ncbi:MAG: flavodoxin family protein [Clostridiales bacterium]|nr:flavodoxin family protein [Clostridiales bacterium]